MDGDHRLRETQRAHGPDMHADCSGEMASIDFDAQLGGKVGPQF